MRIFGWVADEGACAHYRVKLPLGVLGQQDGVETMWSNKLDDPWPDGSPGWECDVIVAQRTSNPGPVGLIERMVKHPGKRPMVVFEIDDDLWSIPTSNKPAYRHYMIENPEAKTNMEKLARLADLVTVTTPSLANRMRRFNPNVAILPNFIPAEMLAWNRGGFTDRLTIGWQGSPTHAGDWAGAPAEMFRRWFKNNQAQHALECHVIGQLPETFPGVTPLRNTDWAKTVAAYYRVVDFDIALAPLANNLFNDSKSHLRLLEAAAYGIPVVASDNPNYRVVLEQHRFGFIVEKPAQWGEALDALMDETLRSIFGTVAFGYAAENTIEKNAHLWLEAYQQ